MIAMTNEIGTKNTKNEILEAYHEALEQLKVVKKVSKQEIRLVEEKKKQFLKQLAIPPMILLQALQP